MMKNAVHGHAQDKEMKHAEVIFVIQFMQSILPMRKIQVEL